MSLRDNQVLQAAVFDIEQLKRDVGRLMVQPAPRTVRGSFTPFLTSTTTSGTYTYSFRAGFYYVYAKMITLKLQLFVSGITAAATGSVLRIGGLPPYIPYESGTSPSVAIGYTSFASGGSLTGLITLDGAGAPVVNLYTLGGFYTPATLTAPAEIYLSCTYEWSDE